VVQKGDTHLEVALVPVRAVANGQVKWTTSQILPNADPPATPVTSPCD
jgi:hypothetical protein